MDQFIIKAFEIGKSLNVGAALAVLRKHYPVVSIDPLMLALSVKRGQYLMLNRYGVIGVSNWSESLEQKAASLVSPFVNTPVSKIEYYDEIKVAVDSNSEIRILFDKIIVPRFDEKFILVIGSLLVQSVGLESYEKRIDLLLNGLNRELVKLEKPRFFAGTKDFTSQIIKMINLQQEIVANVGVLDKPELTWDDADSDFLYSKFSDELELSERTKILSEKIDFLKDSMKTGLEILNAHKSYILEVAIVALFILDILLYLLDKI